MDSTTILILAAIAFFAWQKGLFSVTQQLPPGTTVGTILQNPDGSYVQATQTPNGNIIAQPITATQAQGAQIAKTSLGTTSAVSGVVAAASSGALGFGTLAASLSTVGLIGAAVLAVYELCRLIFKGADPNQIPASKIEQVYECFSEAMQMLYQHGLIAQNTAISMMNAAIQGAQQAELNAPAYAKDSRPFNNGVTNATNSINGLIKQTQTIQPIPLLSLTLEGARAIYMGAFDITAGHWYPASVAQAYTICDTAVSNLISSGAQ